MTIKNVYVQDNYSKTLGHGYGRDTNGGQDLYITIPHELSEMIEWWRAWGPVFKNLNPTVTDAL
jgi:hypothetical protein